MAGLHYSDYILKSGRLLSLQQTESEKRGKPVHDEVLFVIVHQVYELWFKEVLHELDSILKILSRDRLEDDEMGVVVARLHRITRIQKLLIEQLHVLETMTPLDFLEFRDLLTPASGFQSFQFRLIEVKLGVPFKDLHRANQSLTASGSPTEEFDQVKRASENPSLCQLVQRWLERIPFLESQNFNFWSSYRKAAQEMLERDRVTIAQNPNLSAADREGEFAQLAATQQSFESLFDEGRHQELLQARERHFSHRASQAALFINLYRDEPVLQPAFRFLTMLIDMDELFMSWRHRHFQVVHRMVGTKIGTGGSSGSPYLRSTIESRRVFSDLANISTYLIPRSAIPPLPPELRARLRFAYAS